MIGLLDTSILIALSSEAEATPDLGDLEDTRVSSLTWSELTLGIHMTRDLDEYKRRSQRLMSLQEAYGSGLPYDDACDDMYDEVLRRVGQRRGTYKANQIDRMIAATAMANELVLVTRNAADFRILDGLLQVVER